MPNDKVGPGDPAIGFSLDCKINDRRAMVIQTYLPIDSPSSEINVLLEKLVKAADRLEIRYRLKDMRLILQKQEEELPLHEKKLASFEDNAVREHRAGNRRGEFEWKGNLKASRDNLIETVAAMRNRIKLTKEAIVEAEEELASAK